VHIDYDLENTPLEISTDSEVGSGDWVIVYFRTAGEDWAGGVVLRFSSSTVEYKLLDCSSSYTPLTTLPATREKVWRVTKTRSSSEIRVTLHCNGVEVLNTLISGTTCGKSDWNEYWTKDVEKIWFHPEDASDYYRPGE
jgi:hypothetical protein